MSKWFRLNDLVLQSLALYQSLRHPYSLRVLAADLHLLLDTSIQSVYSVECWFPRGVSQVTQVLVSPCQSLSVLVYFQGEDFNRLLRATHSLWTFQSPRAPRKSAIDWYKPRARHTLCQWKPYRCSSPRVQPREREICWPKNPWGGEEVLHRSLDRDV